MPVNYVHQLIEEPVSVKEIACKGCSYNHYDEEGNTVCGSQESECPRGKGRF